MLLQKHFFNFALMLGIGIAVKKANGNRSNFFRLSKFVKTVPNRIDIDASHDFTVIADTLFHFKSKTSWNYWSRKTKS